MKIKFLKDREVESQGIVIQSFKTGQVVEMSTSSARRWIRRGLATEVQGSVKPARTKSKPAAKPAPKKAAPKKTKIFDRKPPLTSPEAAPE